MHAILRITAHSRLEKSVARTVCADFGPEGGTIGRAETNTLVLDDPERTVSRVHAQLVCRNGQFVIVDRGSNPLYYNGVPLGAGNEAQLNVGDRLAVGNFELEVSRAVDAATTEVGGTTVALPSRQSTFSDDPFDHLLDGLVPAPEAASPPAAAPFDPAAALFPDPLGVKDPVGAPDDPLRRRGGAGGRASSGAYGPGAATGTDDFSDLLPAAGSAGGESIDVLFGLDAGHGDDLLASSPLADPLIQPNTAAASDPLAALSRQAPLQADARSDHVPVGDFGFIPPAAAFEAGEKSADLRAEPVGPDRPAPRPARPAGALEAAAGVPEQRASPFAAAAGGPALAGADELSAAFLRGLGTVQKPLDALTPELMERVGELLRAAVEGTLQLLLARQEIKREVRADVTMIAAQANNPLKFSPNVEVALAHLLGPGIRGFMPAKEAMRDAWVDLRAHEFGVMVGMRAALEHVIGQFAPGELEKNIATRSRLDALFAANRKAKLWDQFVKLYAEIARDAEDDFHSLFGKAFLKAYEEQLERLKAARPADANAGPNG